MVTFIAPLNKTGYGTAARYLGRALYQQCSKFQYKVISNVDVPDMETIDHRMLANTNDPIDYDDDVIVFWHMFDSAKYITGFKGRKTLYTTFELDGFKPKEVEQGNQFDEIVTASDWGTRLLHNYFPSKRIYKVRHAPYGDKFYDDTNLNSEIENYYRNGRLDYINSLIDSIGYSRKCNVFSSSGKYESRKSQKELLEYMVLGCNNVLIASWYNPFIPGGYNFSDFNNLGLKKKNINLPTIYHNNTYGVYSNEPNSFTLVLLKKDLDYYTYHKLLHSDGYIAPSKAEGWNLNLSNMIANTLVPCFATSCSGHSEYARAYHNIITDSKVLAKDNMFFDGTFNWSNVDRHVIAGTMDWYSLRHYSDELVIQHNINIKKKALEIFKDITWEKEALKFL